MVLYLFFFFFFSILMLLLSLLSLLLLYNFCVSFFSLSLPSKINNITCCRF